MNGIWILIIILSLFILVTICIRQITRILEHNCSAKVVRESIKSLRKQRTIKIMDINPSDCSKGYTASWQYKDHIYVVFKKNGMIIKRFFSQPYGLMYKDIKEIKVSTIEGLRTKSYFKRIYIFSENSVKEELRLTMSENKFIKFYDIVLNSHGNIFTKGS